LRSQFEGLTLGDFYKHDYNATLDLGAKADKVAAINPPVSTRADTRITMLRCAACARI
jgi:hypothetical protein